jgi:hypothetical protein
MAAFVPYIPMAISALSSIGGGLLSKGQKETQIQSRQRELIDEILASIKGEGPFSNLFNVDEDTFQKSFVEPAKQRFQSQIAPQIQQSFIAGGQQRGTGMEDTLARAGVDMDQLLNQQYGQLQQQAQQRQLNALSGILGQGAGVPQQLGFGEKLGQSLQGYLSGEAFPKSMDFLLQQFKKKSETPSTNQPTTDQPRKGYES